MINCAKGIASIKVKDSKGNPSALYSELEGNLKSPDMALRWYALTQTSRFKDIAYSKGYIENSNGEYSFDQTADIVSVLDVDFNKDLLKKEAIKDLTPAEKGIIENILELSERIESPPTLENGSQAPYYMVTDKQGNSKAYQRTSAIIKHFFNGKTLTEANGIPTALSIEEEAREVAERLFKNLGVNNAIYVKEVGGNMTKDQFIQHKIERTNRIVGLGTLSHLGVQRAILERTDKSKVLEIDNKIADAAIALDLESTHTDWIDKGFESVLSTLDIHLASASEGIPAEFQSNLYSEVKIHSELLGFAGTADAIQVSPSGSIKVLEFKTGVRFGDSFSSVISEYSSGQERLAGTAINKSFAQSMLLSMAIKAENPAAAIDIPTVVHLSRDENNTVSAKLLTPSIADFLDSFKTYFSKNRPIEYKKLLEQSPKVFDPESYGGSIKTSYEQQWLDNKFLGRSKSTKLDNVTLSADIKAMEVKLQSMVFNAGKKQSTKEAKEMHALAMRLANVKSTMTVSESLVHSIGDISWADMWTATMDTTANTYISAISQHIDATKYTALEEYNALTRQYDSLLNKVLKDRGLNIGLRSKLTSNDIFGKYYAYTTKQDKDSGGDITSMGLITEASPEWVHLKQSEKDFIKFISRTFKKLYEEALVSGDKAQITRDDGSIVTKLQLYEETIGRKVTMDESFVPRIGVTLKESKERFLSEYKGVRRILEYFKWWASNYMSSFYEDNVDYASNQDIFGMPVKGLGAGTSTSINPEFHSTDLSLIFKSFTNNMLAKKHLDDSYALGTAMQSFLAAQKDGAGNKKYEYAAEFLQSTLLRKLLIHSKKKDSIFRHPIKLFTDKKTGKPVYLSISKLLKNLTGFVASSALFLKVDLAVANASQAIFAASKESLVNKLVGLSGTDVPKSLDPKKHAKAYKLYLQMQKDAFDGKLNSNIVHTFMKNFRMYPELSMESSDNMLFKTVANKVFDTRNLNFMMSIPEQMTVVVLTLDSMMSMDLKTNDAHWKGKSMWDYYAEAFKVDDEGNGYFEFEELPELNRGYLKMGDNTLKKLGRLEPHELQKIRATIHDVKGGYRSEEKSKIEDTMLGEFAMLFKRWLWRAMRRFGESKRYSHSTGSYYKIDVPAHLVDAYGKEYPGLDTVEVYEWRASLVEGRIRTLTNLFLDLFKERRFNWDKLSIEQKKGVFDATITLAAYSAATAALNAAKEDRDEQDRYVMLLDKLQTRSWEHMNPLTMLDSMTSTSVSIVRLVEFLRGIGELTTSSFSYGAEGYMKGSRKVLKNIPVASGIFSSVLFIDDLYSSDGSYY